MNKTTEVNIYNSTPENNQNNTDMETEANEGQNPQTISLSTVAEMFRQLKDELKTDIAAVRKDFSDLQSKDAEKVSDKIVNKCIDKVFEKVNDNTLKNG